MWTKFLFALAAVTNGQWRKTSDAKVGLFAYPAALEELQQLGKKTSAFLGMDSSVTIGSRQLTKMVKSYYPEFGYAATPIV